VKSAEAGGAPNHRSASGEDAGRISEGDVRINDNPFELGRLPHRSTLHLRYFHTAECGKSLVNALAEIVTEWRLS